MIKRKLHRNTIAFLKGAATERYNQEREEKKLKVNLFA